MKKSDVHSTTTGSCTTKTTADTKGIEGGGFRPGARHHVESRAAKAGTMTILVASADDISRMCCRILVRRREIRR